MRSGSSSASRGIRQFFPLDTHGSQNPVTTATQTKAIKPPALPANQEAELFLLGSILSDDSQFGAVASVLQPDDFSIEKHRRIFRCMCNVKANDLRIDRLTLHEELKHQGQLASVGGLRYLTELDCPRLVDLPSYVRIIKEKSNLRMIIAAANHAMNLALTGQGTAEEIIAQHLGKIATVSRAAIDRPGIEVYTYTELQAKQFKPPVAIVEDFLSEGETIGLVGKPKQGKSRLVQQLAVDITRGRPFLGQITPRPRRVLMLDFENKPSGASIRLHKMDGSAAINENLLVYAPDSLMDNPITMIHPDGERILSALVDRYRPDVLIIDNWRLFLGGDENSSDVVVRGLKLLSTLRRIIPTLATVIVHHLRKQQQRDRQPLLRIDPSAWLEFASGHYAFVSHLDACFGLEREKGMEGDDELIVFGGVARNSIARTLLLEEEDEKTLRFTLAAAANVEKIFTPKEFEFWRAIGQLETFRFQDVVDYARTTNRKTVTSMLRKAQNNGLIEKLSDGYKKLQRPTVPS